MSTQTLDTIFILVFGRTCGALVGAGGGLEWSCAHNFDELDTIYSATYPVTYGFVLLLVLVIPMSFQPMTENIKWQIISFIVTTCIFSTWIISSSFQGLQLERVPALPTSLGIEGLVGIILLNFAYVSSVPSWINVKVGRIFTFQLLIYAFKTKKN